MGLLNFGTAAGKIKGSSEAFFATIFAAISADGQFDDDELNTLFQVIANKKSLSKLDLQKTYKKTLDLFTEKGSIGIVEHCAPMLNKKQKQTAYVTALDFLLSDGTNGKIEKEFAQGMTMHFGYDDEFAQKCIDVILWKNADL